MTDAGPVAGSRAEAAAATGTLPAASTGATTVAVDTVVREIAIGGLAGLITGALVYGVGGRLFMRVAALIDPAAGGLLTSNGNRIGTITLEGSLAFITFVGLLFGVAAGIIWVIVRPWLPGAGAVRAIVSGILFAAISPFFVLRPGELDFRILGPAPAVVALLIALAGLAGVVVSLVDEALGRRLPPIGSATPGVLAGYRLLAATGLLFLPFPVGAFFTSDSPAFRPPAVLGLLMIVVGLATLARWVTRIRVGHDRPPLVLAVVARVALLAAAVVGAARVVADASAVIASGPA